MKRLLLTAFLISTACFHAENLNLWRAKFYCVEKSHQSVTNSAETKSTLVKWSNNKDNKMFFEFAPAYRFTEEFEQIIMSFTVTLPENCPLKTLTARFRDDKGEGFVFPAALTDTTAGAHAVELIIRKEDIPGASFGRRGGKQTHSIQYPFYFLGIGLTTQPEPAQGEFTINSVEITPKYDMSSAANIGKIAMNFAEEQPVIRIPGNTRPIRLFFTNDSRTALDVTADIAVFDTAQKCIFNKKHPMPLAICESSSVVLPTPSRCGVYEVKATVRDKDGNAIPHASSFAVMTPTGLQPRNDGDFLFCIQSQLHRFQPQDRVRGVNLCELIGANGLRHGVDWRRSEPANGQMDFSLYEQVVDTATRHGLEIDSVIAYTPGWATDPAWKSYVPLSHPVLHGGLGVPYPKPEYYERFAREAMKRYGDRVKYFEVWNEPELPGFANFPVEDYLKLLKTTWELRNKYAPSAKILNGGFSAVIPTVYHSKLDYVENIMRHGQPYIDIMAVHAHGSFEGYVPQIDHFKMLLRKHGITKPWWSNETSVTSLHIGQYRQAATLVKKIAHAMAEGAMGYTWHNLRCNGTSATDPEHHFGLLNHDFSPRMAYLAFNTTTGLLHDARFAGRCLPSPQLYAYQFKTPRHNTLVAWHSPDTITGLYWLKATAPTSIDIFGNRSRLPMAGGYGWLQTSGIPAIAQDTASMPALAAPVVAVQTGLPAIGQTQPLTLEFSNPTPGAVTLDLEIEGIAMTASPAKMSVTIPPGGIQKDIQVTAVANGKRQPTLKLAIARQATGQRAVLQIPLHSVNTVTLGKPVAEQPAFTVKTRDNVRSLVPNAPTTAHLVWKNADDLSAVFRWGATDSHLLFQTAVTDDVHCTPETGALLWKGDSVQLMLTMPGQRQDWEFGFAKTAAGIEKQCYSAVGKTLDDGLQGVEIAVTRDDAAHVTSYTGAIPWATLGLPAAPDSFRFNVIFNDNDEKARESMGSFTRDPKASGQYLQIKLVKPKKN